MAKMPVWMQEYYASSPSGSVISAIEKGDVRVINVDASRTARKDAEIASMEAKLAKREKALARLQGKIDEQYHLFTRCAKGKPCADQKLYEDRNRMRDLVIRLKAKIKVAKAVSIA